MHILIITPYYAPDLGPSAPMFTTLSKSLLRCNHQVTVIAMVPNFPTGYVLQNYKGRLIQHRNEEGVDVVRVAVPSINRANLFMRLFQSTCYQLGATLASLSQKYDTALISGPAISCWILFIWHVALRHKPAIYSVHDVYPDVGIKLGIFRHKLVISAVAGLERFCLNHSAVVQIISDSFRPGLRALGVPDAKMALIPVWVDTDFIHPLPHENAFTREHHLTDHFIVLYAGNIGLSQGLEHILTTAELLVEQKNVYFVIVGDGAGRELLQSQAKQRYLSNVQFLPYQPSQCLPDVLACSHISLVMQRRGFGADSLPSKTFSIMASGRPILASVDEESETWKLIMRAEAGLCVPPEDPTRMAEAIMALINNQDLCERLGHNGRMWVEEHHSPQSAAEQFEQLFINAVSSHKL